MEIRDKKIIPVYISKNVEEILECDSESVLSPEKREEHIDIRDRERARVDIEKLLNEGKWEATYRFVCKDGKFRWV